MRYKEFLILGTLFVLSAAVVYAVSYRPIEVAREAPAPAAGPTAPDKDEAGAFTVVFAGDLALGENFGPAGAQNVLRAKGYTHPFANFASLLESADQVLAGLETPIIEPPAAERAGRESWYWTSAAQAPAALKAQKITAVSLANDHILDFGADGLRQTLGHLDAQGIKHLGAGLDAAAAGAPLRFEARVGEQDFKLAVLAATADGPGRVAVPLAEGETAQVQRLDPTALAAQIVELRAAEPALFIVAYLHWGRPYRWMEPSQQDTAHQLVDAGADLVVGAGTHMMQQLERYKERWIVYGLGNFVFSSAGQYQKRRTAVPFGLLARLLVTPTAGGVTPRLRVYPIHVDNQSNGYQGHFLDAAEMADAFWPLLETSYTYNRKMKQKLRIHRDRFGRHFTLDLTSKKGAAR